MRYQAVETGHEVDTKCCQEGTETILFPSYCLPVSWSSSCFWHETGKDHNL